MTFKKTLNSKTGLIQLYIFALMGVFLMTGLSLLGVQQSSMSDFYDMKANSQARFLAASALQEGRYFVMVIDGGFLGTSAEQTVTAGGRNVGTYQCTISRLGKIYTITGTGYVPNKAAKNSISHTLSSSFTYEYLGVGVVLLSDNSSGALTLSGNAKINVLGGRIVVNSSSATGTILSNNAKITAPEIDFVGGYSGPAGSIVGTVKTGVNPVSDPLAHLPVPVPADLGLVTRSSSKLTVTNTTTLQPGVYAGGLAINSNANVTLAPGVYYIQGGGLSVSGNANLTGNGVIIYNLPLSGTDAVSIGGNGNITLTGPTAGPYRNVTFFQERTSTVPASIGGNGMINVGGDFYFPSATLNLSGNSKGTTLGSLQVAARMNISGNGTITINAEENLEVTP